MGWKRIILGISLGLWCLIAIVPFASRTHYLPLPQWWAEMETVWLALGCAGLAILAAWSKLRLTHVSLWCIVLGLLWALQTFTVPLVFPGLNYTVSMAWGVLALLALGTVTLREVFGAESLTLWLARALVLGACVQSVIGFIQLSGWAPFTHGFLFYDSAHPATNIFGHLGQRNQYAHYLMWGVIALLYLYAVGRLAGWKLFALTVWLAILLASAGSRTILLYEFGILLLGLIWHWRARSLASARLVKGIIGVCIIITAMQFLFPLINLLISQLSPQYDDLQRESGLARLFSHNEGLSSRRLAEMHKAWLVFQQLPWWGAGWSQFGAHSVQLHLLPLFAHAGVNSGLFLNAHNLILQLLAEMGGIVSCIVLFGLVWLILPYFRKTATMEGFLPLACLTVTIFHSFLEYPLWYFYFLAMAIIFLSLAPSSGYPMHSVLKWGAVAGGIALATVSVKSLPTYYHLTELYGPTNEKVKDARHQQQLIAIIRSEPLYAFHALYTLDDYLVVTPESRDAVGDWIIKMAAIRPYPNVLLKQAQLEALNGEPQKAVYTMQKALASFPTYARYFLYELERGPKAWAPLRALCQASIAQLARH